MQLRMSEKMQTIHAQYDQVEGALRREADEEFIAHQKHIEDNIELMLREKEKAGRSASNDTDTDSNTRRHQQGRVPKKEGRERSKSSS